MRRNDDLTTRPWLATIAVLVAVLLAWPSAAHAAPAKGPEGPASPSTSDATEATEPESPPADASSEPAPSESVESALEQGDLSEAAEQATAARRADPSPENWRREAEVLERKGDYEGAAAAYQGELDALPEGDAGRDRAAADLQRVRELSRGRVKTEPASKHREELDAKWAAPTKKAAPKKSVPPPVDKAPEDRIVRKWYFWVTVAAIVASAAAVTGIAIKAARDERRDALDLQRRPSLTVPPIIRF